MQQPEMDDLHERIEDLLEQVRRRGAAEEKRTQQRRAWDREHLRTVSTKLPVEEDRRFRRYCRAQGSTRYEVLRDLIRTIVQVFE